MIQTDGLSVNSITPEWKIMITIYDLAATVNVRHDKIVNKTQFHMIGAG